MSNRTDHIEAGKIEALTQQLCPLIEGRGQVQDLIAAASYVLPFTAAFVVVNRRGQTPLHLCDTYAPGAPKEAVQLYVNSTYLLNPVYNAFLAGLKPGVHAMADLAPDNWSASLDSPEVLPDTSEEIGYRTPGWPRGLQELSLTVDLGPATMGEVSFSRPSQAGGFTPDLIAQLRPFHPLFACAFRAIWSRHPQNRMPPAAPSPRLEDFAADILSPRERQVVEMILKGHSSLSISLALDIALPTVKTHRKNAYSKLGISTQQQLFGAFLDWQKGMG